MEKYTLIVTEKPDSAARIASALDTEGKPKRKLDNGVQYYVANRSGEIVVVPALGHLYTVAGEKKGREQYPVLDYKWVPLYIATRAAKRTRTRIETIQKLSKKAGAFIDGCDFDIEGSIIGFTILKYACEGAEKAAKRMKYSTLTKEDIEKSFEKTLSHLDFYLIEAGMARHEVDWLYGINLSRALTTAAKKASGMYAALTTGRVQGPTLKFLASRERSIRSFVPIPYWRIKAKVSIDNCIINVEYEKASIETLEEAGAVSKACRRKMGKVEIFEKKKFHQPPPPPFDLSSLQNEAYRLFRYTPMRTSSITQRLYLDALISYPRTSSQKLPFAIGYESILKKLARNKDFSKQASELLAKTSLRPHEGKGFDSAHPAIYPTGNLPEKGLNSAESNIWRLVIKRFMAVFGEPTYQQNLKAIINVNGYKFNFAVRKTLEEGWIHFYEPYAYSENTVLPRMQKGTEVYFEKVVLEDDFTQPPVRYNPASLLRKMQTEEIGTKSTRAGIIQTLYDRKYICNERITVTDPGLEVVDVLRKYCPAVVSSDFTRKLEEKMKKIQRGAETKQAVVNDAIETIKRVTEQLKEKEIEVGSQLSHAIRKAKLEEKIIGTCPTCKNGKLLILHSKKTGKRFVGCTGYFENTCKTAFSLPQRGSVKPQGVCKGCGWSTVRVLKIRTRPWTLCFNPECSLKRRRTKKT